MRRGSITSIRPFSGLRIKCPVTIEAGLGDYVCPPSGVAALYNGISAPKKDRLEAGTHARILPA